MIISRQNKIDFDNKFGFTLDDIVEWITNYLDATDIYMLSDILDDNEGEVIKWIKSNKNPDDVFSVNQLEYWAMQQGMSYDHN